MTNVPSPEFAGYEPGARRARSNSIKVRVATPEDAESVARIDGRRSRVEPAEIVELIRKDLEAIELGEERRYCCVALAHDTVVGYGKLAWTDPTASEAARNAPAGWYLTGLVVTPEQRGQGIGEALTVHRIEYLAQLGAKVVYYFSTAINTVTIDLHAKLGFTEVTRDFAFPHMTFTGGTGVLFKRTLE